MDNRSALRLVDEVLDDFRGFEHDPFNSRKTGTRTGFLSPYLQKARLGYARTIRDIAGSSEKPEKMRILEIGAFFGVVAICLSKLGYQVYVTDIPEFISNRALQAIFDKYGLKYAASDLRDHALPYEDETFDMVVMCEVLEHLNFNPLPVVKEVNRIGRKGCLFYLSLPNIAHWHKRLALLRGRSIHNPIEDFFHQLSRDRNMIVGLHWREYTASEVREMLEGISFSVQRQYYFTDVDFNHNLTAKRLLKKAVLTLFPSFKENQTTFAVKRSNCDRTFAFTDVNRAPRHSQDDR